MLDRAEPTAVQTSPAANAPAPEDRADPCWLRSLVWLGVAIYLLVVGSWAYRVGMRIRDDTWVYSRTIRFHGDIANSVRWGNLVLRTAERVAAMNARPSDKTAVANPTPGALDQRPLTFFEILRGEDQVYQDLVVGEPPDGDYRLDYPPLRLLSMTLWTRAVQSHIPFMENWPGRWELRYSATGNPGELVTEDIAEGLLLANAYSVAGAAVVSFLLVWIWVNRGGRPALPTPRTGWTAYLLPRQRLVPWKLTPLRMAGGLVLFPLTATVFFYGLAVAEAPVPSPPPSVQFDDRPILSKSGNGTVSATISATINGQGADAQWFLEWGLSPMYGNQTSPQTTSGDDVSATIDNLPPNTTIHYRLSARNDDDKTNFGRGVTHTNDETFNTADTLAPMPSRQEYSAVWLSWEQWTGLFIIFVAMCGALRMLPPEHRGWAAGLIAAILIWFDPGVLVDSHIWPQWDVWTLPPFLLAALLGTLDWWFVAGLVLGVGVMFKGQTLVTAPILLLWPLLMMRWGAVLRIVIGFVLSAGLVLSPWLVLGNQPPDWTVGPMRWIGGVMVAAAISACLSIYRRPALRIAGSLWNELSQQWHGRTDPTELARPLPEISIFDLIVFCASLLTGIIIITLLVLRRWPSDLHAFVDGLPSGVAGTLLLLGILLPPWFIRRRALGVWVAAILAATLWMTPYMYQGDWSWKTVGFEYGARKFTRMALGAGGNGNLPLILQERFGWDVHDPALTFHLPDLADPLHLAKRSADGTFDGWVHTIGLDGTPVVLDIRQFLMGVFGVIMVLAAAGTAIQTRRNDPRFLAALVGLWTLMPNILCQMAGRYQIWGGAVSALIIAVAPELTLLHVIVSVLAAGMVAGQLLGYDASRSPQIHELITRFQPDDGWIMIAIGAFFLLIALTPAKRPAKEELAWP
jgi:hypothetical protein